MSTAFYTNLATTALRLLTDKGQDLTLRTIADTTPGNAYEPTRTPTDVTVKGIRESSKQGETNSVLGGQVLEYQYTYLIAASGLSAAPELKDQLVDNSIVYEVVEVEAMSPAGTAVVYTLRVK